MLASVSLFASDVTSFDVSKVHQFLSARQGASQGQFWLESQAQVAQEIDESYQVLAVSAQESDFAATLKGGVDALYAPLAENNLLKLASYDIKRLKKQITHFNSTLRAKYKTFAPGSFERGMVDNVLTMNEKMNLFLRAREFKQGFLAERKSQLKGVSKQTILLVAGGFILVTLVGTVCAFGVDGLRPGYWGKKERGERAARSNIESALQAYYQVTGELPTGLIGGAQVSESPGQVPPYRVQLTVNDRDLPGAYNSFVEEIAEDLTDDVVVPDCTPQQLVSLCLLRSELNKMQEAERLNERNSAQVNEICGKLASGELVFESMEDVKHAAEKCFVPPADEGSEDESGSDSSADSDESDSGSSADDGESATAEDSKEELQRREYQLRRGEAGVAARGDDSSDSDSAGEDDGASGPESDTVVDPGSGDESSSGSGESGSSSSQRSAGSSVSADSVSTNSGEFASGDESGDGDVVVDASDVRSAVATAPSTPPASPKSSDGAASPKKKKKTPSKAEKRRRRAKARQRRRRGKNK